MFGVGELPQPATAQKNITHLTSPSASRSDPQRRVVGIDSEARFISRVSRGVCFRLAGALATRLGGSGRRPFSYLPAAGWSRAPARPHALHLPASDGVLLR